MSFLVSVSQVYFRRGHLGTEPHSHPLSSAVTLKLGTAMWLLVAKLEQGRPVIQETASYILCAVGNFTFALSGSLTGLLSAGA